MLSISYRNLYWASIYSIFLVTHGSVGQQSGNLDQNEILCNTRDSIDSVAQHWYSSDFRSGALRQSGMTEIPTVSRYIIHILDAVLYSKCD